MPATELLGPRLVMFSIQGGKLPSPPGAHNPELTAEAGSGGAAPEGVGLSLMWGCTETYMEHCGGRLDFPSSSLGLHPLPRKAIRVPPGGLETESPLLHLQLPALVNERSRMPPPAQEPLATHFLCLRSPTEETAGRGTGVGSTGACQRVRGGLPGGYVQMFRNTRQ